MRGEADLSHLSMTYPPHEDDFEIGAPWWPEEDDDYYDDDDFDWDEFNELEIEWEWEQ